MHVFTYQLVPVSHCTVSQRLITRSATHVQHAHYGFQKEVHALPVTRENQNDHEHIMKERRRIIKKTYPDGRVEFRIQYRGLWGWKQHFKESSTSYEEAEILMRTDLNRFCISEEIVGEYMLVRTKPTKTKIGEGFRAFGEAIRRIR
mgnify:CR=1 FL=1